MPYRFLLLSSVLILGACAYAVDTSIQEIEVITPGAQGSLCHVYVDKLHYKVYPPQKVIISNTKEDLVVDCLAPGNRRKKIIIEPEITDNFYRNAGNGLIGMPWDALSGAMFKYPDVIEIDFSRAEIKPEKMPAQNAPDVIQPEDHTLEEFRPSVPRLNSDRYNKAVPLERRQPPQSYMYEDNALSAPMPGASDMQAIIDSLGPSTDPTPMGEDDLNYDALQSPELDSVLRFLDAND